ncbi:MAG TPA: dienelactone hydrolase family protein [Bryobacteraceae bacterium]|nr:dienelactone hydrolase family protein [Bryobacteraceae bacterium]
MPQPDLPRRDFMTASVAGLAAVAASSAALPVVETTVHITTPDGHCDAAFVHPSAGAHPGVLIWPDAFGLRPSLREIGRRVAAAGYSVLVPNPFYRVAQAPIFESAANFDFNTDRAKLAPLMNSINAPGAAEKDAVAFIAFLDSQPQVDKSKKIGTQGYCMGGPLVVKTCAAVADRVGAGASFHGGGLVTDQPSSPHLLAPKINARMYFGIAANDDARQPDAKDKLREAFGARAEIEVYAESLHGWCIPDMPLQNGKPIYNHADAERAWGKLMSLYQSALA